MPTDTDARKARDRQSKAAKRATLEMFQAKKPQEQEVSLELNGEEVTVLYRSIGANAYDALITKHKPTLEQRAEGSPYNINTFAPALLARVIIDPDISEKDWAEIWTSDSWNRGEVMTLFSNAVGICNNGLSLDPTESG